MDGCEGMCWVQKKEEKTLKGVYQLSSLWPLTLATSPSLTPFPNASLRPPGLVFQSGWRVKVTHNYGHAKSHTHVYAHSRAAIFTELLRWHCWHHSSAHVCCAQYVSVLHKNKGFIVMGGRNAEQCYHSVSVAEKAINMDRETLLPPSDTFHWLLQPPRQYLANTAVHIGRF